MAIIVNVSQLKSGKTLEISGEVSVAELDIEKFDECAFPELPLKYSLEVKLMEGGILLEGSLEIEVGFECVRCLKKFNRKLDFPSWAGFVPLSGEDKVEIIHDCVDLTPLLREDILLAFPQHPLCESECAGLTVSNSGRSGEGSGAPEPGSSASVWAALDNLKF